MNEFLLSVGQVMVDPAAYVDFVNYVKQNATVTKAATAQLDGVAKGQRVAVELTETNTTQAYGSAWTAVAWWGSQMHRVIQHSIPDQTTWNDYVKQKRFALIKVGDAASGKGIMKSISHNGWTSAAYASQTSGWYIDDCIYWDAVNARVMRCNPKQGTAGVVFNGILT